MELTVEEALEKETERLIHAVRALEFRVSTQEGAIKGLAGRSRKRTAARAQFTASLSLLPLFVIEILDRPHLKNQRKVKQAQ